MTPQNLRVASPPADLQVAIYARVSSDQQAERHTIDSQIAELKARALQDGYQVREDMLFIDNGHSGASLIRPALERLRDLIAFSVVDVVYVHAPDRLARSYAHQVLLLEEFSRAGTQVVFLNRPIGHRVGTVAARSLQARRDRVVDITRPALPTPSCGGSHRSRREP